MYSLNRMNWLLHLDEHLGENALPPPLPAALWGFTAPFPLLAMRVAFNVSENNENTYYKNICISLYIIKKTKSPFIRRNAVQVVGLTVHTDFCIRLLTTPNVCRQLLLFFTGDKRNIQNTEFNVMYFSVRVY